MHCLLLSIRSLKSSANDATQNNNAEYFVITVTIKETVGHSTVFINKGYINTV